MEMKISGRSTYFRWLTKIVFFVHVKFEMLVRHPNRDVV